MKTNDLESCCGAEEILREILNKELKALGEELKLDEPMMASLGVRLKEVFD